MLSKEQMEKIAGRSLENEGRDRLDFFEVSKDSLKSMLEKAAKIGYDIGYDDGEDSTGA